MIFGDVSAANESIADTLDRLRGLYTAKDVRVNLLLSRLRNDYAYAVSQGTDYWKPDAVTIASKQISAGFQRQRLDAVTAADALQEYGLAQPYPKTKPEMDNSINPPRPIPLELSLLRKMMPLENLPLVNGIRPTDPRIDGGLLAGI